jgi:hypothetical protein
MLRTSPANAIRRGGTGIQIRRDCAEAEASRAYFQLVSGASRGLFARIGVPTWQCLGEDGAKQHPGRLAVNRGQAWHFCSADFPQLGCSGIY